MNSPKPPEDVRGHRARGRMGLAVVAAVLAASAAAAVCVGPAELGPSRVARLIGLRLARAPLTPADASAATVLFDVRLPRVCLAVAVGASLALAGVAMQALFRNPLASPYVLGVSSGAAFGAALVMLAAGAGAARHIGIPPAAVAMGLATSVLVYGLARGAGGLFAHTLLLSGLAVGAFFSALVSLVLYVSGEWLRELVFWLMGGLWRASWPDVFLVGGVAAAGYAVLHVLRRPLDVLALGERGARDVGLNVRRTKKTLLVVGSVL
ncbi:iron ABC transporter permease, partial [bacterium]|nr:iron ABC transporter permease [bacterium]